MTLIFYNAVLDSVFLVESDQEALLIYFFALTRNPKKDWVCLGQL